MFQVYSKVIQLCICICVCICVCVCVCALSCDQLFSTQWTKALQAPLSMAFSRQEYWSRLPFPSPRDLPNPGIKPTSLVPPVLAGKFFYHWATWKAYIYGKHIYIWKRKAYIYVCVCVCVCILFQIFFHYRASLVALLVKNPPALQETQVQFLKICWRRDRLPLQYSWASLVAQLLKKPPTVWETWVQSLGWEGPLEKGKGYPLQYSGLENSMDSMASQRVRHNWVMFTFTYQ